MDRDFVLRLAQRVREMIRRARTDTAKNSFGFGQKSLKLRQPSLNGPVLLIAS